MTICLFLLRFADILQSDFFIILLAKYYFLVSVFPCLAGGQRNHLQQEVLFVQTDAFRGENVKEGCFERKAPTEEKPQLTKERLALKKFLPKERHPTEKRHNLPKKSTQQRNYTPQTETTNLSKQA